MNIIAVDDERPSLNFLLRAIQSAAPDSSLAGFVNPEEALGHTKATKTDAAFLDIRMGQMDGMTLAKKLRRINSKINIIFVTGHSDYTLEAFGLRASGYVCKPVSTETIKKELENLRHPVSSGSGPRIRIQTFGNFDIFIDDIPLVFRRKKAKEILAYLVDKRGSTVYKKELAAVLWEDDDYSRSTQTYLQILISEMLRVLKEAEAGAIVRRQYNSLSVVPEKIECDYYNFLNGDLRAIEGYNDEYMANYSWAEITAGSLSQQKKRQRG